MEIADIARAEARVLERLVMAGRRAAALDGRHLLLWGILGSLALGVQYLAEVQDWLPSRMLWLWQPLALAGFVASVFLMRRGAGRRLGHPVSRAYAIAFAAAGLLVAFQLISTGAGDAPAGLDAARWLCAAMGGAFLFAARMPALRWMLAPAAGWWLLLAAYALADRVVPIDWLRLAMALLVLLAAPGAVLIVRARHESL